MVYRLMPHLSVARAAPRPRIKYNKSKRYDDFNRRIGSSRYRVFQKVAFERRTCSCSLKQSPNVCSVRANSF